MMANGALCIDDQCKRHSVDSIAIVHFSMCRMINGSSCNMTARQSLGFGRHICAHRARARGEDDDQPFLDWRSEIRSIDLVGDRKGSLGGSVDCSKRADRERHDPHDRGNDGTNDEVVHRHITRLLILLDETSRRFIPEEPAIRSDLAAWHCAPGDVRRVSAGR